MPAALDLVCSGHPCLVLLARTVKAASVLRCCGCHCTLLMSCDGLEAPACSKKGGGAFWGGPVLAGRGVLSERLTPWRGVDLHAGLNRTSYVPGNLLRFQLIFRLTSNVDENYLHIHTLKGIVQASTVRRSAAHTHRSSCTCTPLRADWIHSQVHVCTNSCLLDICLLNRV